MGKGRPPPLPPGTDGDASQAECRATILLDQAAFAKLRAPYLLIISGEKRDGMNHERLAAACGPGQRVVVMGRLSDAEVGALFRRSDLFVFPTLADIFPLSVPEAVAQGLPVPVPAPPGDTAAMAASLTELAAVPARLLSMGQRAKARVAHEFIWDTAAANARAGYSAILA